jgi:hypothetical protein
LDNAKEFYKISRSDLEASKLLFDHGKYPQSIFYLQQSVEKATKSFNQDFKTAKKKYRHKTFNIFIASFFGIDIDTMVDHSYKELKNSFNEFKKDVIVPDIPDVHQMKSEFNKIASTLKKWISRKRNY